MAWLGLIETSQTCISCGFDIFVMPISKISHGQKLLNVQLLNVAGVVMQAIVGDKENVWGKHHVAALCKICPMLRGSVVGEAAKAEVEGYGTSKLTVESAVKYLQLANKLFFQAELFHFCADILELIIPVHRAR